MFGMCLPVVGQQVLIHRADGTRVKLHISELDSIEFEDDAWVDPTGEPNRIPATIVCQLAGDTGTRRAGMNRIQIEQTESDVKNLLWQESDSVSLFQGSTNSPFTLISGAGTISGSFSGVKTNEPFTVIYPYRSELIYAENQVKELVLPAVQAAHAGGADSQSILMMSHRNVLDDEVEAKEVTLGMRNICSYLVVTPTKKLDRIVVSSADGSPLAGNISVRYQSGVPSWTAKSGYGSSKVTLEGPLTAGNTYYIAVLPGTLEKGFRISSYDTTGKVLTKKVSAATFERAQYHDCSKMTQGDGNGFVVDLDLEGEGVHRYWSSCNIGAAAATDAGDYFAWGEVTPVNSYGKDRNNNVVLKSHFSWDNYFHGDGREHADYLTTFVEKYGGSLDDDLEQADDGRRMLEPEDDAAHVIWGGPYWRMPSKADFDALTAQCQSEFIADYNGSGICGFVFYNRNYTAETGFVKDGHVDTVKSGENTGKEVTHIFLPFGGYYDGTTVNPNSDHGYYWSNTVDERETYHFARAYDLMMGRNEEITGTTSHHSDFRRGGQNIRPIYDRVFTFPDDEQAWRETVLPVILPPALSNGK